MEIAALALGLIAVLLLVGIAASLATLTQHHLGFPAPDESLVQKAPLLPGDGVWVVMAAGSQPVRYVVDAVDADSVPTLRKP